MGTLDIEQAASVCGLSPREVRLLIEGGRLPATRPSGRWLVQEADLIDTGLAAEAPEPAEPSPDPEPMSPAPVRAIRGEPDVPEVGDPEAAGDEPLAAVLARLEQSAVQIADLRAERDELRLQLRREVASLQGSLEQAMEELDTARARVAELEAGRFERSVKDANTSARAALTPLFRATARDSEDA